MSRRVATLGKVGFLEDPHLKIDYLMNCFFFSKASQTRLYRGNVKSLSKLIQRFGNDESKIRTNVEDSLRSLLTAFFTTVQLTVLTEDRGDEPGIYLLLNGIVSDRASISEGSISIGYSLAIRDSKLKSILNTINGTALTIE